MESALLSKYNIPLPRYTSYPTVPYWDTQSFSESQWKERLKATWASNPEKGIDLYMHLPFCERLCTFCGCNKRITKNHQVERPYIEALLKEWKSYLAILGEAPSINQIHLGGGSPSFFSPENLVYLLEAIFQDAHRPDRVEYSFEANPNTLSYEHLVELQKFGFNRLSLGIQDFDPEVQRIINREQPVARVQEVCQWARDLGYPSLNFDLIYGLPLQTMESVAFTLDQTIALKPDRIAYYSYAHVPWRKGVGQRLFSESDLPQSEKKFALYSLGRERLLNAGYVEIGMDHFALPSEALSQATLAGKVHRNFMGYTTQLSPILLGLGASAISDCGTAFAQNEKKVETYQQLISQGESPIEKGHIHSDMDLEVKEHILNIMCQMGTQWQDSDLQKPLLIESLSRLQEMHAEGLVHIEANRLSVTEMGRSFLRNVGLAFDQRYWEKQYAERMFSMSI